MKKIKSYLLKCYGFTLTELLAVAVILAILAVMATGSFRLAIEKARFAEGLQAAEKVAAALERFYYENPNLPFKERIYPSMDQLDLSFSNMSNCPSLVSSADEDFVEEHEVGEYELEKAKQYESRCKKIGQFEVGLVKSQRGCATIVTAIRGGSRALITSEEKKCALNGHCITEYHVNFDFANQGVGDERFNYKDYMISVYPSFFDGSVGLRKCLAPSTSGEMVNHMTKDWLARKKVSCTGLERLCASVGFTENPGVLDGYEPFAINRYAYQWFRP